MRDAAREAAQQAVAADGPQRGPPLNARSLGSDVTDFGEQRLMIQPVEMTMTLQMELHESTVSTTTDVWNMLVASRDGDLDRVKELAHGSPALLTCQYDYTTPMHFAVREGHFHLVRYLVQCGALDPTYLTHPFRDSLVTMAEDRDQVGIAELLTQSLADPKLTRAWGDTGKIDYGKDETQHRLEEIVNKNKHAEVETLLREHPELALDEAAFWGEGILMMPAKDGDRPMLELLMRFGARVPDSSKWGARYYLRHYEIAAFLMENGMNPNHMNWRQFTLLHDMAYIGDLRKAGLLLDHGADINPIDEDYSSTPLGFAARWGSGKWSLFSWNGAQIRTKQVLRGRSRSLGHERKVTQISKPISGWREPWPT